LDQGIAIPGIDPAEMTSAPPKNSNRANVIFWLLEPTRCPLMSEGEADSICSSDRCSRKRGLEIFHEQWFRFSAASAVRNKPAIWLSASSVIPTMDPHWFLQTSFQFICAPQFNVENSSVRSVFKNRCDFSYWPLTSKSDVRWNVG